MASVWWLSFAYQWKSYDFSTLYGCCYDGVASTSKGRKNSVGTGSWRTTALLAYIVWPQWLVIGTEIDLELVHMTAKNIQKYHFTNTTVFHTPETLGFRAWAPYDKILVSAAVQYLPDGLLAQLKVGGTMVIPIWDAIWRVKKVSPHVVTHDVFEWFAFVPLVY